jgi:hypothetical protein
MAPKLSTAQITDLDATFDAVPVESVEGPLIWATVRIVYSLQGLSPAVTIRVPVPWNSEESQDERRSQALRAARRLIDHACRTVAPAEADMMDDIVEPFLEGVAQELGLAKPTARPKPRRRP